ncbi:MAG: hypothetical protein AB1813_23400 [Verrucomicrobiota bacterium]
MSASPQPLIQAGSKVSGIPPVFLRGQRFDPQRIRLTGQRWLIEYAGSNTSDAAVLWGDLPASHGLYTPLLFDPETNSVLGQRCFDWWAQPFEKLFSNTKRTDSVVRLERLRMADQWIVLNTLDDLFGHSLLLLLNAEYYLEHFPGFGLIVVISPNLRRYVPQGVAEIWELQGPARDTVLWHESLDQLFAQRCGSGPTFVAIGLSLPAPSNYHLERFQLGPAASDTSRTPEAPVIMFIYRGSRLWGGTWRSEQRRLQRLGRWLRDLWPGVKLRIYGHARLPAAVPGWEDRTRREEPDYDAALIAALRDADLVLGAHGSSMLIPTAVARLVLELVPLDKHASLLQDCLFNEQHLGWREHFWRLRFLYGNGTMTDIYPLQVARMINAMISGSRHFHLYQATAWDEPERMDLLARSRFFEAEVLPGMEAWKARLQKTDRIPWPSRFWQWLRRMAGEWD